MLNILAWMSTNFRSLVGGTANSVARISGTLGNTLAYLSLDDDFQKVGDSLVKVLSTCIIHVPTIQSLYLQYKACKMKK